MRIWLETMPTKGIMLGKMESWLRSEYWANRQYDSRATGSTQKGWKWRGAQEKGE